MSVVGFSEGSEDGVFDGGGSDSSGVGGAGARGMWRGKRDGGCGGGGGVGQGEEGIVLAEEGEVGAGDVVLHDEVGGVYQFQNGVIFVTVLRLE